LTGRLLHCSALGRLRTYAVSLGQEAVAIGIASAMQEEDVLLPSYRDNGALIWRGVKLEEILLFWGGDERGNDAASQSDEVFGTHNYESKIALLETRIKQLEQQSSMESRFAELERHLDARQQARDEAKRGARGLKGEKGERGERGLRGEKGEPGAPAKQPLIIGWKIDAAKFRAVPFGPDGMPLPELDLRPLFQALYDLVGDLVSGTVREELERLLQQRAFGW
jgi:hypothetical protein